MRTLTANNPGLFTLDGTRTYVVGRAECAVIDPGPADDAHLAALLDLLAGAHRISVLLTHGHADHAAGAADLAERAGATVWGSGPGASPLAGGEAVSTDEGELVALATPGHTPDHLSFHWPAARAAFVGDLLLGRGDTTWVAEYPGCVRDYLESLDRLEALDLAVLHPAHGPDLTDPSADIARFREHRRERIRQVAHARARHPHGDLDVIVQDVYGGQIPSSMLGAARESVRAILDHHGEQVFPTAGGPFEE